MTSTIYVTPYVTCTPVSEISTTGLIGRLLLFRVVLSHFLLRALRSPHGLLLLLLLRDLLPLRTLIFEGLDPFDDVKKGVRYFGGVILGYFFYACI